MPLFDFLCADCGHVVCIREDSIDRIERKVIPPLDNMMPSLFNQSII